MEVNAMFHRDTRSDYPELVRAEGVYLYDSAGKRYIDASSGPMLCGIGHGVKEVVMAMADQAEKAAFAPLFAFRSKSGLELARRIVEIAPPNIEKVWFSTTGAEAIEGSIKLAQQYFIQIGKPTKRLMISRWRSYHGATLGALSLCGDTPRRRVSQPLLIPFPKTVPCYCYRCPFGREPDHCDVECANDLETVIKETGPEHISAFIAEPIVGSGVGVSVPHPNYFRRIREICDRYEVLLVLDEIMTGFGRTGKPFAIQHWDVAPDVIVCAKGITAGYSPLSALLVSGSVWEAFDRGTHKFVHSGTMSGNPVACAAGLAVLDYMREHNLTEQSRVQGEYLFAQLQRLYSHPIVGDIRGGKGLMVGIELVKNRQTKEPFPKGVGVHNLVIAKAFEKGASLYGGDGCVDGELGSILMIGPPLTVTKSQIGDLVDILDGAIEEVESNLGIPFQRPI